MLPMLESDDIELDNMNIFIDTRPQPFTIDGSEKNIKENSESRDIALQYSEGRIYVRGPGDFEGFFTTNRSHLVKDVLMEAGQVHVLRDPDFEYYVCDNLSKYNLGVPAASPNTIIFIGQTILVKTPQWYWKIRIINSSPAAVYESSELFLERPIKQALRFVDSGSVWVEITRSQTPHACNTFMVDIHWWKDPSPNVKNYDGKIKL